MKPGQARAGWLALLVGVALTACPAALHPAPEDPPPDGYAWEDLKEVHTWMLRPVKWSFRRELQAPPTAYDFAPQAFEGEAEPKKGLRVSVMRKTKDQTGKSADDFAATQIANIAMKTKVLNGSTAKGEPAGPFTTYVLVCIERAAEDRQRYEIKILLIANRETDALYAFMLVAPASEWKDVEQWGDTMLADLRLDPKF